MRCKYFFSAFFQSKEAFFAPNSWNFLSSCSSCCSQLCPALVASGASGTLWFPPTASARVLVLFLQLGLVLELGLVLVVSTHGSPQFSHQASTLLLQHQSTRLSEFLSGSAGNLPGLDFDNSVLLSHYPLIFCVSQNPQLFDPWYRTHPLKKDD